MKGKKERKKKTGCVGVGVSSLSFSLLLFFLAGISCGALADADKDRLVALRLKAVVDIDRIIDGAENGAE